MVLCSIRVRGQSLYQLSYQWNVFGNKIDETGPLLTDKIDSGIKCILNELADCAYDAAYGFCGPLDNLDNILLPRHLCRQHQRIPVLDNSYYSRYYSCQR